jgi:hypothetical protein
VSGEQSRRPRTHRRISVSLEGIPRCWLYLARQEQIHSAFRVLCCFAAAATLLMAAIEAWTVTSDRSSSRSWTNDNSQILGCWIHAALSCGTHLAVSSPKIIAWNLGRRHGSSAAWGLLAAVLLMHIFFVAASGRMWEDERTGWGLGIANLLTAAVASLLRWDRHDSTSALRELEAARYKHKAL